MDRIIERPRYFSRIQPFIDKPLVKVLTGVRRCGKSTILQQLQEVIRAGSADPQVFAMNFESADGLHITDAAALLRRIEAENLNKNTRAYFFFDEIQQVADWEKAINAIRVDYDADIYVTGSNSRMLSGDLATHLAGRYVEFLIQPFSFAEFVELHRQSDRTLSEHFQHFVQFGGFPALKYFNLDREPSLDYLDSVYNSVVLKDVIEYHQIRDVDIFHRIVGYCFANIGKTFSAQSLVRFFKSEGRTVSVDTVLNYLEFCVNAFLIYRVPRFDIAGKARLRATEKYYAVDHGFRETLGLSNQADIELTLENIVCVELLARGYEVSVGRAGAREIDFIARKGSDTEYFQVSYLLGSQNTVDREFGALRGVTDNFPKTVLSMDQFDMSRDGIQHKNIIEWLVEPSPLHS
ncbi:ATP-binding protein [Pseudoglutamicibacter albus]|uniref:ATP-binding protein n=1 Tax=Micrococcaceae TaxID=1268 RepID=UPI0008A5FB09|nr:MULTISPECIES: ATP-binding protein [Micrococcaceae]MDK7084077.1 ATP-binding protein [Pseudoglutamicibacter cumminsii]OFT22678.1 ATPase [Arthrobacter sp. HMSC08H08]OFT42911.1 ATPase [Arthrobacter sp. HMSC06H05]PKY79516.1 ATP-binding protein [Pseudoglutamicibacter albus]WIK83710.1 ATP-binding protein [Pseudoglutamicibacter albus]